MTAVAGVLDLSFYDIVDEAGMVCCCQFVHQFFLSLNNFVVNSLVIILKIYLTFISIFRH